MIINYKGVEMDSAKALKIVESEVIELTYKASRYNQVRAARALGISRGCLRMKLAEYFPGQYIA